MDTVLPSGFEAHVQNGDIALFRHQPAFTVVVDGKEYRILKQWDTGFTVAADSAPPPNGVADFYGGPYHLFQCVITQAKQGLAGTHFRMKRAFPLRYDAVNEAQTGEHRSM